MAVKFQSIAEAENFIKMLVQNLVQKCDAQAKAAASQFSDMQATIEALRTQTRTLEAELAAKSIEPPQSLIDSQTVLTGLEAIADTLASTFNPTPGTDALVEVVQNSEAIPTPPALVVVESLNTPEETPPAVLDEAVRAMIL